MCIVSFYQCPKTKGERKQTSAKGYSREKEGSASYSFQAYNCGSVEGVTDGRTLGAVSVQTCLRLGSEEIRGGGDWGTISFKKSGRMLVVQVFASASGPPRPSAPNTDYPFPSPSLTKTRTAPPHKRLGGRRSPWPAAATQRRPCSTCGDSRRDASGRAPRAAREPPAVSLSGLRRRAGARWR